MSRRLESGKTKVVIDRHGSIIRVANVETGHVFFEANESDRRLFQLTVPSSTWASRPIHSHECAPPEIVETDGGYVLRYENMELDGEGSGIAVEVCFEMPEGADQVLVSMALSNQGKETVTGVTCPWINGWQDADDLARNRVMLGPNYEVKPGDLPKKGCAWGNGTVGQEFTSRYPVIMMLPWIDYSGPSGGVSCINYQKEPRQFYTSLKNMAGQEPGRRLGILTGFYAYVAPGSEWNSPVMGISVHDGDWHQTADRYREWMDREMPAPDQNSTLRESIGSEHLFFSQFDGTPVRDYKELAEIAAFAREHGVNELCVWDREGLGTYGATGSGGNDLFGYSEENRKRISEAVHKVAKEGTDVSALVNLRLIGSALDAFKNGNFEGEVQTALDGTAKVENWTQAQIPGCLGHVFTPFTGPYCNTLSPFSAKYRQRIKEKLQEYLDLGYTWLFYDQPFEDYPDYSRKDQGGIPEMTYAETLDIVRDVKQQLRKEHPNAQIMGEQCDAFGSAVIDQWMTWGWSNLNFEAAVRVHYSLPKTVINCVLDREPGLASRAFAAGLHFLMMTKSGTGTLADTPEFAAHIGKLARLRKRCAERTVHARFCDQHGVSVKTDDGIVAYSYESRQGPAVIVAAPEKSGTVQVKVDRSAFAFPAAGELGELFGLDGTVELVSGDCLKFDLSKHDVKVWVLG